MSAMVPVRLNSAQVSVTVAEDHLHPYRSHTLGRDKHRAAAFRQIRFRVEDVAACRGPRVLRTSTRGDEQLAVFRANDTPRVRCIPPSLLWRGARRSGVLQPTSVQLKVSCFTLSGIQTCKLRLAKTSGCQAGPRCGTITQNGCACVPRASTHPHKQHPKAWFDLYFVVAAENTRRQVTVSMKVQYGSAPGGYPETAGYCMQDTEYANNTPGLEGAVA